MRKMCNIDGCAGHHQAKGLCDKHYTRLRRTGTTNAREPLYERLTSHGYVKVTASTHPLSDSRGQVYEHQLVLFNHIGPGPHKCHWCPVIVDWKNGLHVDHLDGVKHNNDGDNLVPSCGPCNRTRSLYLKWKDAHPEDV